MEGKFFTNKWDKSESKLLYKSSWKKIETESTTEE